MLYQIIVAGPVVVVSFSLVDELALICTPAHRGVSLVR